MPEPATAKNSITLRFLAAPTDVGYSGTVDAGTVLEWIDKAAYACAVGWSKSYCVTAYVGNIHFADPVLVGDMVEVESTIIYTGRSSMHIQATVSSGDPKGGGATMRSRCLVIFVAVGKDGKSIPVEPWIPRTEEEKEQEQLAIKRLDIRADIEKAMSRQVYTDAGTAPRTVLRFLAAPSDVNWGGKVHGGTVMKWIDEAAYVCASRYCGKDVVAVFSGGVRFYRPLLIGNVVEVEARLVYTGNKGMHVSVHVRSGDPKTGELELTTYCLTVMVARDETGTAVPIPPWHPVSNEDRELEQHVREIIRIRSRIPGNRLPSHLRGSANAD
ncbi:acyl-CoA thioesterase [Arthrobacter crystallopoietes]|uniref:Acyl-CoA hydrolase n=1 Tax=Crystallibacter crystallopoietes TaxID=37928 RepID=A0A1H1GEJ4_9MICC|nr:acyl-CoA thioesterase [Arthrobacter crystallopoietes]AUI52626.1 acyl-CoA thioesterase [Arthrobacter crystallopoietes]SDR11256.1 Acyl-CoA hydrolase [Arthrobacter crystallopoietes]